MGVCLHPQTCATIEQPRAATAMGRTLVVNGLLITGGAERGECREGKRTGTWKLSGANGWSMTERYMARGLVFE